jgi:tetratricopeptide (TPR) repeat protein
MRLQLCSWSLLLIVLILIACEGKKAHSLEALSQNKQNNLQLAVNATMEREDYLKLFETFQDKSIEEIEQYMSGQAISLQEASFGFYYLANAYAKNNDMEQALLYHTIAAEQYLNPQSYLKLAEREYFLTKDFAQAFYYLHHALEIALEITQNNQTHPIAKNIKHKSQFLLQELEQIATKGGFDRAATWAKLKAVMENVVQQFRTMYHTEKVVQ